MKKNETSNGYSLVIGGTGVISITSALRKMGFKVQAADWPERCLEQISLIRPQALILTDNMICDPARRDNLSGHDRLLILLDKLRFSQLDPETKIWLIVNQQPSKAWQIFSQFESVYDIRQKINVLLFANDLLAYLRNNQPLAV